MMKVLKIVLLVFVSVLFISAYFFRTQLGLNYANLDVDGEPVIYPSINAIEFDSERLSIQKTFEKELYGPWPKGLSLSRQDWRMVDNEFLGGKGTLQETIFTIGEGSGARRFHVVLALPVLENQKSVGLIINQSLYSNCMVLPHTKVTSSRGVPCNGTEVPALLNWSGRKVFGEYIAEVPVERIFDAGFGFATFDGTKFVPDDKLLAPAVMTNLAGTTNPTSVLMSWAYAIDSLAEHLGEDDRIKSDGLIAMGHSRFGKAALVATAWGNNIDATIAHQSGFAGAASSRSKTGERLERMAVTYPHWVRPGLADDIENGFSPSYDQNYLLAMASPTPIFLGNGRRDVWSDPNSTWRIAKSAHKIYAKAGLSGLTTDNMEKFDPNASISYYLRPGGHSITPEDIDVFLDFAKAHAN